LRAEIKVSGIVQGVGFRPFIYRTAVKNRLTGYVRNRGDAGVEIVIEGAENNVKHFINELENNKPPLARIYNIAAEYFEDRDEFEEFTILKSSEDVEFSGSVIPPDVSICNECLKEMRDSKNRRHDYFFTTCTDCGPRYTTIRTLPYDRPNTTMQEFPMCPTCQKEYTNPLDRRFHAQTIACQQCGPSVYLASNRGETLDSEDPIREAGRLLEKGYIVAVKGNGGFHVACATTRDKPIARLRKVKHRREKPFAIMTRDLATVKTFAEVSPKEAELLTSYIKPIILLNKTENYYLSDLVAPSLHNVGVMLPYTGLHFMLFDTVKEPAFVMTSANAPNEPIVVDNDEAVEKLGSTVDFFLFHNRMIAQRCDDSVVRLHENRDLSIIRRSRGYAPEPIQLKRKADRCVLGLGAEENVTACILLGDRAFVSQHVGDVENVETLEFLKNTVSHLIRLTNAKIDIVACDLHPKFATTRLAYELGESFGCQVVQVQHHHAHLAALMAEHNLGELVGIVCDGFGYSSDGSAWGGEILLGFEGGFERLGHLQAQPMVGGDLATIYPLRMATGMLYGFVDVREWLLGYSDRFPHGEEEVEAIIKQLEKGVAFKTSSCGRVLDAVSALLGVCYERTFEGEPAMKLESMAVRGKDVLGLEPKIDRNTVNTSFLLNAIFNNRKKYSITDLAYSAEAYLAKSLAELAASEAKRLDIKAIGFSGGVAYNEHVTKTLRQRVEENGIKFVAHRLIPAGDAGTSAGQTIVANFTT
jgi:hydrogenase maturation protein HypF